jgi:hypothetical protein
VRSNDPVPKRPTRKRKGKANNLPGATAKKPGWNTPVMRTAKILCWRFAVCAAGSEERLVLNKDWEEVGLTGGALLKMIRARLPEFDEEWKRQDRKATTDEDKAQALRNRVLYMYLERKRQAGKDVDCVTAEHPLRSLRLLPHVHQIIAWYDQGKIIRREDL